MNMFSAATLRLYPYLQLSRADLDQLVGPFLPPNHQFDCSVHDRAYFSSVFYHYLAARNDAVFLHDDFSYDVFLFWVTEFYRLCPIYFSHNYAHHAVYCGGVPQYYLTIYANNVFLEGNTSFTLTNQPRTSRLD